MQSVIRRVRDQLSIQIWNYHSKRVSAPAGGCQANKSFRNNAASTNGYNLWLKTQLRKRSLNPLKHNNQAADGLIKMFFLFRL